MYKGVNYLIYSIDIYFKNDYILKMQIFRLFDNM